MKFLKVVESLLFLLSLFSSLLFISKRGICDASSVVASHLECYDCVQGTVKVDPYKVMEFSRSASSNERDSSGQWRSTSASSSTARSQFVVDGDQCPLDGTSGYGQQQFPSRICASNRCVQMTIFDSRGHEVGIKHTCLEEFLTSYVMFVAPNSSNSRALTDAYKAYKAYRDNSDSYHRYDSQVGDPNFASDQPMGSRGEAKKRMEEKINNLTRRTLEEICGGNDKRIPCKDNYLDSEVCRIQCCSSPLCNTSNRPSTYLSLPCFLIFLHLILKLAFSPPNT